MKCLKVIMIWLDEMYFKINGKLFLFVVDIIVFNYRLILLEEGEKNLIDKFKEVVWLINCY